MREIKFRAWHEGYPGKLTPAQMLYDEKPGDCLVYRNQGQPVHVMQFTGLKDKNGVEIYEGDIVRDSAMTYGIAFGPHNGYDEHEAYGWYLKHEISDKSGAITENDQFVIEVIGNIWENPELLKQ